jgi:hypothetical protein
MTPAQSTNYTGSYIAFNNKKETGEKGVICIDAVGYEAAGHSGDGIFSGYFGLCH